MQLMWQQEDSLFKASKIRLHSILISGEINYILNKSHGVCFKLYE